MKDGVTASMASQGRLSEDLREAPKLPLSSSTASAGNLHNCRKEYSIVWKNEKFILTLKSFDENIMQQSDLVVHKCIDFTKFLQKVAKEQCTAK